MSDVRKFRFVSPGIFLNEVDQSQIPAEPELVGPVVIGRAERGPGMTPVKVGSFSEFVEKFGNPIAGRGGTLDVWRDGNYSSPTYAAYAAQAYLRAGVGPVTFLRLMGSQHSSPESTGYAGWTTTNAPTSTYTTNGGPYGLFVWPSAAMGLVTACTETGSLAAVFYIDSGAIVLSGTTVDLGIITGSAAAIKSDSSGQFKAFIYDTSKNIKENITFSLAEDSPNFIRKVFNTNPQRVNTTIENSNLTKNYWLGETYERHLVDNTLSSATTRYGAILAIASGSSIYGNHQMNMAFRDAQTGWFFGQNLSSATSSYEYNNMQKLFKFVGIDGHGSWLQNNIKISISNIKASQNDAVSYGSFDVLVRKASDSDQSLVVLERYSGCNLDPGSLDYIGQKIGTTYTSWDETEKRYREFGRFGNRSQYVRVVMNESVDGGGVNAALLPFGVYGPPRFPSWTTALSGTDPAGDGVWSTAVEQGNASVTSYALGSSSIPESAMDSIATYPGGILYAGNTHTVARPAGYGTASIIYPAVAVRHSASNDGADPTTNAYFGLQTGKSLSSTVFDPGYGDYLRPFGKNIISDWSDTFGQGTLPGSLAYQWTFSLDEIRVVTGSVFSASLPTTGITDAYWESGSYKSGTSWNASASLGTASNYENILDSRINRFSSPMFGGYDGLSVKERDPFRNTRIDDVLTEVGNYTYHTLRRAIDTVADPEVIQTNMITIPGITNENITKYLLETCEARADALAIIDVKSGFQPRHESNSDIADRRGNLQSVLDNMKARNLNNSYGAAYYPWVRIRDDLGGTTIEVPPSVVALGVMATTERAEAVWFAPAGFQRGGLSHGAGGLPVVGVETKLTSRNRDDLYDVNINPIASFPAEGIVVFGQKTLQATRSALDRINVRRLLIFVKRGISRIASTTLFQPNVQATWNSFKSRADNFLADVKVRFGVDAFRVILDDTTTTADLIDRNIMYAKIFIKPTRAIEFIAIDFIITRSGASFED